MQEPFYINVKLLVTGNATKFLKIETEQINIRCQQDKRRGLKIPRLKL